ncbi:MAG: DUF1573 domain-containing protein [Planctomycetaceae bacterium]|jgi:hypothetical protein|nr:DUF1573 domain-containing protein [Planctomycetaceae bacterium]
MANEGDGKITEACSNSPKRSSISFLIRLVSFPFCVIGLVLIVFCVWSFLSYGDIRTGLAAINGVHVIAKTQTIELGEIPVDEVRTTKCFLKNIGSESVVVLGAWADCDCITTSKLPITISTYSEVEFDIDLYTNSSMIGKKLTRQILLNLSIDQPALSLLVKFNVAETKKSSDVK